MTHASGAGFCRRACTAVTRGCVSSRVINAERSHRQTMDGAPSAAFYITIVVLDDGPTRSSEGRWNPNTFFEIDIYVIQRRRRASS